MGADPPFSVLLPVWAGDRVDLLRASFRSVVIDQSRRPDDVVIVRDGPVPADMDRCLEELRASSPVRVTLILLDTNLGLGPALDAGLSACAHDVVARMDADDIAMRHRFRTQIPLMTDADIVGAGLVEFSEDISHVVGRRIPPIGQHAIMLYARLHDPFNHPTVVYRRSAVLAAGGYGDLPLMEDYWLFARMLANGARAANLTEPLVYYRVDVDAYRRRGGSRLLRSELELQRRMRDEALISGFEYARNVTIRGSYRLIPWWVRRGLYRGLVQAYGERARRRLPEPAPPRSTMPTLMPAIALSAPSPVRRPLSEVVG
jgi:glycosyltransferase involved in cell wall biosynthesis